MTREARPTRSAVWQAIETYLRYAYPDATPPQVAALLERLRQWTGDDVLRCPVFEREGHEPRRFALRIGNREYPHMKLVVESLPSRDAWFFRADTHDRHLGAAVPESETEAFHALMARNQRLASAIEAAWARQGLMTFREFLRHDLEQRIEARGAKS